MARASGLNAVAAIILFALPLQLECFSQTPKKVTSPYEAEGFSCEGKPDGRLFDSPAKTYGYGRFRIAADLNFDGLMDLILSRHPDVSTGCGTDSCDVVIYLSQPDKTYVEIGFDLHPLAVALKRVSRGEGQLVTYAHISASEGTLNLFKVTSNSVTPAGTKALHTNNSASDKATYEGWFSGNQALKAESASCARGQLVWSPLAN